MLQKFLDRYPFMLFRQRPLKARAIPPTTPPHGWLRNVLEKITGAGSVNEADVAELEYQEYVTRLQNPMREGWLPHK